MSAGTKGNLVLNDPATGAFTYTLSTGATGGDSFTFKASDNQADSNVATVTVTIGALNHAPVASNAIISTGYNVQFAGTLGASDQENSFYRSMFRPGGGGTLTDNKKSRFAYDLQLYLTAHNVQRHPWPAGVCHRRQ